MKGWNIGEEGGGEEAKAQSTIFFFFLKSESRIDGRETEGDTDTSIPLRYKPNKDRQRVMKASFSQKHTNYKLEVSCFYQLTMSTH